MLTFVVLTGNQIICINRKTENTINNKMKKIKRKNAENVIILIKICFSVDFNVFLRNFIEFEWKQLKNIAVDQSLYT